MSTTPTGGVRLGGSGFGPEYVGRRRRQVTAEEQQTNSSSQRRSGRDSEQEAAEIFLFTVKDPVRTALTQLMSLIKVTLVSHPAPLNEAEPVPEVIAGPLGYTSVKAVRPVSFVPTKTVFKPVTR